MSYAIFNEGIGYEGKVTLTLKSNNHVLKSQTYKNNGTVELFKFLGNCLAGKFPEAEKALPNQILLLYNNSSEPTSANARLNLAYNSKFIGLAQTPSIVNNPDDSVKVVYNFEVPYTEIQGKFNQIALYGADKKYANIGRDYTEFSAYYYLLDKDGNFEYQDASTWSATTVLLIEWELSISNKNEVGSARGEA